jgi:hypothetical protein
MLSNRQVNAQRRVIILAQSRRVLKLGNPRHGLRDAAAKLGVSHHQVRKLIKAGILSSEQIMTDAPHQIRAADLESERVIAALKRKGRPCRVDPENQISMFLDT